MSGPAIWGSLLNQVRAAAPGRFVVAGGAIRDYWLGLDPKDIDIFVDTANRDDLAVLAEEINKLDNFDVHMIDVEEYEVDDPYLVGCIEGSWTFNDEVWPINIVARPSLLAGPLSLVKTFDFGILQAWWDLTSPAIQTTPACDFDRDELFATLMHDRHPAQSLERFNRFRDRNGDVLTFRDPNNYMGRLDL
ncbi:hypothetical protein [Brevundimonas phage AA]|uniref:Poly A polymerase head domain-containing protein n=1 Tax=Brevundimonas phage AA TaxID=2880937 RepID=A0AAN0KPX0_9CAUD|nr:hypothetical protein [Brevundimonas phage BC]UCR90867.1 hypothetical protein [Brevundimonas phage AA]